MSSFKVYIYICKLVVLAPDRGLHTYGVCAVLSLIGKL